MVITVDLVTLHDGRQHSVKVTVFKTIYSSASKHDEGFIPYDVRST